ncbi:Rho GTPase-activating protein 7 [Citrus sinensis]|nr:Rho GTPase-activating protein 7 [Citrus sinensis]
MNAHYIFFDVQSALPQRGGEVNLTLGGIDLNNSGSVVVREDKKLLTVLFPDGRDGRAFTLKAETSEDLYEWKTALELALAQAPSAALVMGHNGIFRNDTNDTIEGSFHQWRDKRPVKSLVVGRPILLALEDIDGGPSFLEKALRFLEKFVVLEKKGFVKCKKRRLYPHAVAHSLEGLGSGAWLYRGTKVEGILRQAADVEEVDRRVQEYEQGKTEFSADEDAHVIGDCVKHVLRELPSSPVPASCCTALLEAYMFAWTLTYIFSIHTVNNLPRILRMMHTISSHAHENRMTPSAVAACMAPLLLRPLLAGECELEDDFDMNGDNSAQLLAAANAANNAQAIIATLLEEYENIFDDESLHRCSISADSHVDNSGSEDSSDEENLDMKNNGYHDAQNEVDPESDDDPERAHSGKLSESSGYAGSDLYDYKKPEALGGDDSDVGSPRNNNASAESSKLPIDPIQIGDPGDQVIEQQGKQKKGNENSITEMEVSSVLPAGESYHSMGEILSSVDPGHPLSVSGLESSAEKPVGKGTSSNFSAKRSAFWGRSNARKTSSVESIDSSGEEELAIQRLEITKNDLRHRIAKEVSRLQEQLQAERDLRAALEVGLSMSSGQFSSSRGMDSKTRAELEEIALAEADVARLKQKVAELHHQLNQQRQHHYGSLSDACDRYQNVQNHNSQQRFLQQDFDSTLAFVNHERKQRTEENLLGADWRNIKGQGLATGSSNRLPRKQFVESTSLSDSKSTEASTNVSMDELCGVDSASVPSTSRPIEATDYARHPSTASSALVELTTRLDFFKERRSQLMEQLHNLDLNYGTTSSQDFIYRPSSPPWN